MATQKLSVRQIHKLISSLYWRAHSDGMVAAGFGTDFGAASITIASAVVEFFDKGQATRILKTVSEIESPPEKKARAK